MLNIEKRSDGDWEVWDCGALLHYGTLQSCGEYISLHAGNIEDEFEE